MLCAAGLLAVCVGVMLGSMQVARMAFAVQTCTSAQATNSSDTCNGNSYVQDVDLKGGDDLFNLSGGADIGLGNDGVDTFYGGAGADTLYGDNGWDNDSTSDVHSLVGIDGDDGNDNIYGNDGNDLVLGDEGVDSLYGGAGDDYVHADEFGPGGTTDAAVDGGPGTDFCFINGSELGIVANCDGNVFVNEVDWTP